MRQHLILFSLFLSALVVAPCVLAQGSYPSRPVRLIVPYPPGGSTDFVAREVAHKLSEAWGQQMVIDNRPGAGTLIGLSLGAKAAPDGYTVQFGTAAGLAVMPALGVKMPFDPVKDFVTIGHDGACSLRAGDPSIRSGEQREGADRSRQGAARQA